nr:N-acetylmuramoyl-L-alanine amidase [Cohnella kolymensis]
MKKFFVVLALSFLFITIAFGQKTYAAEVTPSIYLNGAKLILSQSPVIKDGTTLVPVRVISNSLGYDVYYSAQDKMVTVTDATTTLQLQLNHSDAVMNGQILHMQSKPVVIKGTTMLPFRFIAEQFGLEVKWNSVTKTVHLSSNVDTNVPSSGENTKPPVHDAPDKTVLQDFVTQSDHSLVLSYAGKASYSTFTLQNPNRIVVDVPNSNFESGFNGLVNLDDPATFAGTIQTSHPLIKQIRYGLFDEKTSTIRFVFDLSQNATMTVRQMNDTQQILFNFTAKPASAAKYKVVIDAGHGGKDPGAISVTGRSEKSFTLAVAKKAQALLAKEGNIEVLMTRTGDSYPTLSNRTNLANNKDADAFVSIHANAGPSSAHGTEVFYMHGNSQRLAKIMHDNLQTMVGFNDRKIKTASSM